MSSVKASSFVPRFLRQAQTTDLKSASYPKEVDEFRLKASFGQGARADVPWISLTARGHATSDGYYPVYLYYRDLGLLILAFGISETNKQSTHWPLSITQNYPEISQILESEKKYRYLSSWAFRTYVLSEEKGEVSLQDHEGREIKESALDSDLDEILELYRETIEKDIALQEKASHLPLPPQKPSLLGPSEPTNEPKRPSPILRERVAMSGTSNTESIGDVVLKYTELKVDDYQRTYQWGPDEVSEVWEDLTQASESSETHFFGTLILQGKHDGYATVVDGQQRLTTLFILVSTFRDAITELGLDTLKGPTEAHRDIRVLDETQNFLYPSTNTNDHRFVSNRGVRDMLRSLVIAEPFGRKDLPKQHTRMTLALRKSVNQIRGLVSEDLGHYETTEDKLKRIYQLFTTLRDQFRVLKLVTSDLSESLDIFLTLNNRGLPLGPSDIVRGELMSVLGKDLPEKEQENIQAEIFGEWETILEHVGEPEVFLRHYLVATSDEKVQKKKVVGKVAEKYKDETNQPNKDLARTFWKDLILASEHYNKIIEADGTTETGYHIQLMEKLAKSQRIMLLGIFLTEMESKARNELIRLTFVLAFRWVVANQNAQKLEDFFQDQCLALSAGDDTSNVAERIKQKAKDLPIDPHRYLSEEGDSSFVTRALLHIIHRHLHKQQETVEFDNKKFHLEHIAPQTPTEEWVISLVGRQEDASQIYESSIRKAGNLILLDKGLNIGAQQKPFAKKCKEHYKSATFFGLTSDLIELTAWTTEDIESRTQWLAEMFDIIWSPEKTSSSVTHYSQWLKNA